MIKELKEIYDSNAYGVINIIVTLWGFGQIALIVITWIIGGLSKRDIPKTE